MQIAKRDLTYIRHSRFNKPAITVQPGETFLVETELCSGPWLKSLDDRYDPEQSKGPNPAVVIEVAGAQPGGRLAVQVQEIQVDSLGYTGFSGQTNPLAKRIIDRDWDLVAKTLAIQDGAVTWSSKISLPVRPMIGTLGTAPAEDTPLNSMGGRHGGNMDVQEVTASSTVYLPVSVPGAFLHVGDVHAIQGDGEINNAGGVECRSVVRLKVELADRPVTTNWIRIESQDYLMAVACEQSVDESFYAATRELLDWIVGEYGFSVEQAYLLLGQVMEARCTQFVNPTRSYICKIARKYLLA